LLLTLVSAPGTLTDLEPADLSARVQADARVVRDAVTGAHRLVDVALARRDLFPAAGAPGDPDAARQVWLALLDHLLALDGTQAWYGRFGELDDAHDAQRDEALLIALATRAALLAAGAAFVAGVAGNAETRRGLDAGEPGRRIPAGLLARLTTRLEDPATWAFLPPAWRDFRVARAGYSDRHLDRDGARAWMLPYVEKRRRELLAFATPRGLMAGSGEPQGPFSRLFPARTRAAAWAPAALDGARRAALAGLQERLRPGDVLLVRRERWRTAFGPPGWWHDVAVWVGPAAGVDAAFSGDEEVAAFFRRRGIPDGRPSLYVSRRFPTAWRRWAAPGHVAVVARPGGVRPVTLEEVASGDALAVLRPRLSPGARARQVALAMHYVGKPWDPLHDPEDPRALDAMELLTTLLAPGDGVEEGVELPRDSFLGAARQRPDDLAAWWPAGGPDPGWELVEFLDPSGAGDEAAFAGSHRRPPWTLEP